MSREIETVEQLYNFLAVGDIEGVIDLNSEDTVWDIEGDPDRLAFTGTWEGRQGIADWVQTQQGVLQINEFTPLEFLQNGDRVAVRIRERGQSPFTNVLYQDDLTQLWTVNSEGKITSLESIYNTYVFNQSFANVEPNSILPNDILGQEVEIDTNADSEVSLEIVEDFWTALAEGEEFGSYLAEDVVWTYGSTGDRDLLDFTGVFEGTEGVEEWVFEFEEDIELGKISIDETFVEGNRVLLRLFQDDATVKSNGNQFDQDILSWVTVENGEIQSVENIVDNNIAIEASFPGDNYPLPPTVTEPFLISAFFRDSPDRQIASFDANGNFLSFASGIPEPEEGEMFFLNSPVIGPDNLVYVSSQLANEIVRFDLAGNYLGVFGEANNEDSGLRYPTTTTFGPDGNLYVNSGISSQILQFDGETGEFMGPFVERVNGFPDNIVDPFPPPDFTDLDFGPDGDLYVGVVYEDGDDNPDNGTGTIRQYGGPNSSEPGELKQIYPINLLPTRSEFGPDGNLYLNDGTQNSTIYTFSPDSEQSGEELLEVFVDEATVNSNFLAIYDGELSQSGIFSLKFNRNDGNLYASVSGLDPEVSNVFPNVTQVHIYAGPNSDNPGEFLGYFSETQVSGEDPFISNFSGPSFSNNTSIMPIEIESRFYDLDFYAQANPDLAEDGIDTEEELLEHLQTTGLAEGRKFSPYVDLEFYAQSNPDLAEDGIDTPEELLEHLQTTGLAEGRRFAPTVDLEFYRSANPDLDLGDDLVAYYDHLITTGVEEGRDFIYDSVWDLNSFLAANPEISAQVGGSLEGALEYLLLSADENTVLGDIGFPITAVPAFYSLDADSAQIQRVSQFYQFLFVTDPQSIEAAQGLFTRDFVMDFTGDSAKLPLAGTFEGIGGFREWKKIGQSLDIGSFVTLDFFENGNQVAVRAAEAGRPRPSRVPNTFSPTHIFTFNDEGLITEYRSYYNSYIYNEVYAGYNQTPPDEVLFRQPVEVDKTADPEASLAVAEDFWNAWINGEEYSDFLAEDVDWTFHLSPSRDILPYVGAYQGVAGVEESLAGYDQIIHPGNRSIVESFVEGNRVLLRIQEEDASIRSNGNEFDLDIYSWMSVEDGKLVSVENVVDNHIVVDALFPGDSYPLGPKPRTETPTILSPGLEANSLQAYNQDGSFGGLFGDANEFDSNIIPTQLTRGADGNIYVADGTGNRVVRYDGVTGDFLGVFGEATEDSGLISPTDVVFGPDGNLYVTSNSTVLRFNGSNGDFMGVYVERDNGFVDNIEFGPDNNLYVQGELDGSNSIQVYEGPWSDNPGESLGVFGDTENVRGNHTFDSDGTLYVTDRNTNQVLTFAGPEAENPGKFLGVFADFGSDFDEQTDFNLFEGNWGQFREDGNFYVTIFGFNDEGTRIEESVTYIYGGPQSENPSEFLGIWDEESQEVTILDATTPVEVLVEDGAATNTPIEPYIIATNVAAAEIAKFDEQGTYLGTLGDASSRGSDLNEPNLLTRGPDGNIYVNSVGSNEVLKYDGITGEFLGGFGDANAEDSGLLYPTGINFGPNGNLFVVSGATSRVLEYDGETGDFLGIFAERDNGFPDNLLDPFPPPPDLTIIKFGPDGNAYVSSFNEDPDGDPSNGRGAVLAYSGPNSDNPGEPLGVFGELQNFPGFGPSLFTFGPDGNIYITAAGGPEDNIYVYSGPESDNPGSFLGIFNDALDDLQSVYEGGEITNASIPGISFNEDDGNLWVKIVGFDPNIGGSSTRSLEENISAMLIYAGPDKENAGEFLGNFGEVQVLGEGIGTNTGGLLVTGNFVGASFEENNGLEEEPEPRVIKLQPQDPEIDAVQYYQIDATVENINAPSDSIGFYPGAVLFSASEGTEALELFGFTPVIFEDLDLEIVNSTSADESDRLIITKDTSEIPNFPIDVPEIRVQVTFADENQFDSTDINEVLDAIDNIVAITPTRSTGGEIFAEVNEVPLDEFPEPEPSPEPTPVFGTAENDVLEAGLNFGVSNNLIFAAGGDDLIDLSQSEGGNRAYGGSENDTFILGTGDRVVGDEGADRFFARAGGDNLITGSAGADEFWIATGEIPDAANSITDFNLEEDVIGVGGLGISSADELTFTQVDNDTAIAFEGSDLATIFDVQANELQTSATFAFA